MIYLSIISHGHAKQIIELGVLQQFAEDSRFSVFVRDNVSESSLEKFCESDDITYVANENPKGYGENNNLNFEMVSSDIKQEDFFLVINPDVAVNTGTILSLKEKLRKVNSGLGTINLFADLEQNIPDSNVRNFPGFFDFVSSFLFQKNKTIIDKFSLTEESFADWAAGSLLLFSADTYKKLNGFDEKYFMYCEDIDICYRYKKLDGRGVFFAKNLIGEHFAGLRSRSLLSKHFWWHLKSALLYLFKTLGEK